MKSVKRQACASAHANIPGRQLDILGKTQMAKSRNAKVVSEVLELFSMYTEKNGDKMIEDAISNGDKPSPTKKPETRYEDLPNGRVL